MTVICTRGHSTDSEHTVNIFWNKSCKKRGCTMKYLQFVQDDAMPWRMCILLFWDTGNTWLSQRWWQWDLEAPQLSSTLWLINCFVCLPIPWLTGIISAEPPWMSVWMDEIKSLLLERRESVPKSVASTQSHWHHRCWVIRDPPSSLHLNSYNIPSLRLASTLIINLNSML